jgi:hypothetical protein
MLVIVNFLFIKVGSVPNFCLGATVIILGNERHAMYRFT